MSSSPRPPVPIENQCAVVYDNTLYVYSPSAFQSLPLKNNATWSQLPNGVSVTGAVCVPSFGSGDSASDALWVVGGSANGSSQDFPGLQKYTFASKRWETITPVTKVTQNRQGHGAAYINSTSSILVYAGDQDSVGTPSVQTFLISTSSPYNVLSYSSQNIPVVYPQVLPWDDHSAITVGGSTSDTSIYLFDANAGAWSHYQTTLPTAMKNASQEQASLVLGSDGSKVLDIYDLSVSPNTVTSLVLQDANGSPASTNQRPGSSSSPTPSRLGKRVSLNDWPTYNSTSAPDFTRTDFSLAKDSNGIVALTGGNSDNSVSLFNQAQNAWIDSSRFFGDENVSVMSAPTSSSTSSAPPPPTSSSSEPVGGSDSSNLATILGAVLGSIVGLVIILVAILLFLRYRRNKEAERKAAAENDEKQKRLSFADRGDPYMLEPEHQTKANDSGSDRSQSHLRSKPSQASQASDSSTARLVTRGGPAGQTESMEMREVPPIPSFYISGSSGEKQNSGNLTVPKRTSGWSRYFSGGTSRGPSGVPSAVDSNARGASFLRNSSDTSEYVSTPSHTSSGSVIPPLKLGQSFDGERISRVVTGSPPSTSHGESRRPDTFGSRPDTRDSRPYTMSSMASNPSSIDTAIWSTMPQQEQTSWTPITRPEWATRLRDTTGSSIYAHSPKTSESHPAGALNPIAEDKTDSSSSMQTPRISDPNMWPRPPTGAYNLHGPDPNQAELNRAPSSGTRAPPKAFATSPNPAKSIRTVQEPIPQPQSAQIVGADDVSDVESDEDNYRPPATPTAVTAIPVPASTAMQYVVKKPQQPQRPTNTDMSWVNLGPITDK